MVNLTARQRALLNELEGRPVLDAPFGRLIDLIEPHVRGVLRAHWRPTRKGDRPPDVDETCVALLVTWLDALLQSKYRCGIDVLSDLDAQMLPVGCGQDQITAFCKTFGIARHVFDLLLRLLKKHRREGQRLPDDMHDILANLAFFLPEDPRRPPADLDEAFTRGDLAFVWSEGVGYVLEIHAGQRCEVARLEREIIVIELDRSEPRSRPAYWHGWSRARVGAFSLRAARSDRFVELALISFREMTKSFGVTAGRTVRLSPRAA